MQAVSEAALPRLVRLRRFLRPDVSEREREFEQEQLEIIRRMKILDPREKVRASFSAYRLPRILFRLIPWHYLQDRLQQRFIVVVTDRRVLLVSVPYLLRPEMDLYDAVAADLPCPLELARPPREHHAFGNRLRLCGQLAQAAHRRSLFVTSGSRAAAVLEIARLKR